MRPASKARRPRILSVFAGRENAAGRDAAPSNAPAFFRYSRTNETHITMKEHGEPELLIEHLQPTWLESSTQRVYRLAVLVNVAVAFGLAMSLIEWLFDLFPKGAVGLALVSAVAKTG